MLYLFVMWRLVGGVIVVVSLAASGILYLEKPNGESSSDQGMPIEELPARWASQAANDLTTLLASSDAVFLGRVVGRSARTEPPLALPSSSSSAVAKPASDGPPGFPITIWTVEAVSPLHGGVVSGQTVIVEQPGGQMETSMGLRQVLLEGDALIEVGDLYLFFLRVKKSGAYSSAPFARFPVESGIVGAPTGWEGTGAAGALAGASLTQALQEVRSSGE